MRGVACLYRNSHVHGRAMQIFCSTTAPRRCHRPRSRLPSHRLPEAHTSERQRLRWRSGERLHNRRRPTTANSPCPRMPMPAGLHAHQSRPPHDHPPSRLQLNTGLKQPHPLPTNSQGALARSTTASLPLSPPPLATAHLFPFQRRRLGELWTGAPLRARTQTRARARTRPPTAVRREGRVSLMVFLTESPTRRS